MEELSKTQGIATQRELAGRLDVSLGLVNAFIKRLVRKGYFKVTTIPGRRVRYLFTPKGLTEKSRLTVSYVRYSFSYYREVRLRMRALAVALRARGLKEVALVGTGELAELFYLSMKEAEIEVAAVFSVGGAGRYFLGNPVEPLSALKGRSFDVICLMELENVSEILARLEELQVPKERVVVGPSV